MVDGAAAVRTRTCADCGQQFTYRTGKGKDRKHCGRECRVSYQVKLRKKRHLNLPPCTVDGCGRPAVRRGAELCEVHYCRVRRTGTVEARPIAGRTVTRAGYVRVLKHEHPLADSHGYVFEHRYVVFEQLGPGPQCCHWCTAPLVWASLHIDHLNGVKGDNRFVNLVVSCAACNAARGLLHAVLDRIAHDRRAQFLEVT